MSIPEIVQRLNAHWIKYEQDGKKYIQFQRGQNYYNYDSIQYEKFDGTIETIPDSEKPYYWEFTHRMTKASFKAYFGDWWSTNPCLASFEFLNAEDEERWVNYKPVGANPTDTKVEGNTITWVDCWPGADLRYVVAPEKLKLDIIYKTPESVFEPSFTLKMSDGLRKLVDDAGNVVFLDVDTGERLWTIQRLYAYDAAQEASIALHYEFGTLDEFELVTIRFDDDWAISPARVFPVTIDPTTTIQPDDTTGNDSHIYQFSSGSNYGSSSEIYVGWQSSSTRKYVGLVDIDISSLSGYVITSAVLGLTRYSASAYGNINYVLCYPTTSVWDESTVTWSTQPSYDISVSSASEQIPSGTGSILIETDVLDIVTHDDYTGIWLEPKMIEGIDSYGKITRFFSSEYSSSSYRPKLTLEYTEGGGTNEVTNSCEINYDISEQIEQNVQIDYNIRNLLLNSTEILYNIRNSISNSVDLIYTINSRISNSIELLYDILNSVEQSAQLNYNIRSLLDNSVELNYNINSLLTQLIELKYDIRNNVDNLLSLNYNIAQNVKNTSEFIYDICNFVLNDIVINYDIRELINNLIQLIYIIQGVTKTKSPSYTWKELSLNYRLTELSDNYSVVERKENYSWKELI